MAATGAGIEWRVGRHWGYFIEGEECKGKIQTIYRRVSTGKGKQKLEPLGGLCMRCLMLFPNPEIWENSYEVHLETVEIEPVKVEDSEEDIEDYSKEKSVSNVENS